MGATLQNRDEATANKRATNHEEHDEEGAGSDAAVLDELFPSLRATTGDDEARHDTASEVSDWTLEHSVTVREMKDAVARIARKRIAPGPDGIHGGEYWRRRCPAWSCGYCWTRA